MRLWFRRLLLLILIVRNRMGLMRLTGSIWRTWLSFWRRLVIGRWSLGLDCSYVCIDLDMDRLIGGV